MDFGLVLQTDPPASAVVGLMRRAERNGFRYGWTFDSAVLWQEPFVIYSRILEHTEKLTVGPMVTNPGTRTWEVTASTFATLNDMYGNRTVCGIGRGDSAMRVAGRRPNTLAPPPGGHPPQPAPPPRPAARRHPPPPAPAHPQGQRPHAPRRGGVGDPLPAQP
ncbi:LLM class flavin-dependent oxidoreductase, partial [Streptomyces anulatus]|uniref:LLM class flavin-dependent oxidoreductase n=1 Tax=Streptomyces anulatus TaxID=1892 RepID=UPI00366A48A9